MVELFEVLITRALSWSPDRKDEPGYQLDLSRWEALRGADPTLIPVDTLPGRNPMSGEQVVVEAPFSAVWTHPNGYVARFIWRDGELEAKSVDELTVDKAREIAGKLDAQVYVDVD